jgi:3-deoxy-manno-octulosonate cytidylyltransferase (CMP-KDO synthetase)
MRIVAAIPARYTSSRFPGKPLAPIMGKPMIQHVYERVFLSNLFDEVWVVTDHQDIYDTVSRFGSKVAMTRSDHVSGTDRIWELAQNLKTDCIVNIQGDEPLIEADVLRKVVDSLAKGDPVVSAAYFSRDVAHYSAYDHVKVVMDAAGYSLFFSRAGIPRHLDADNAGFWHHVGIYGYTKEMLANFVSWGKSQLEDIERLEQLRFLENGVKIKIVRTEYSGFGVDRPEDIKIVENIMSFRG